MPPKAQTPKANPKPLILCIHCGKRIHRIEKRNRKVTQFGIAVGTWIHYPKEFRGVELFTCSYDKDNPAYGLHAAPVPEAVLEPEEEVEA